MPVEPHRLTDSSVKSTAMRREIAEEAGQRSVLRIDNGSVDSVATVSAASVQRHKAT